MTPSAAPTAEAAPARDDARAGLSALLRPASVALVGATDRSGWSRQTYDNLRRHSPQVAVYCVTPKGGTVHGATAYTSLEEIGAPVDLVYVMTPRETVPGILREASRCGARAAVVLTAGFGEAEDGRTHQAAAVEAAREGGLALLGPNGNGLVNLHDRIVPFGLALPELPAPGPASFVLQSGGLVKPLLGLARSWGAGVGLVACTGNEAALTAAELAADLIEDDRTHAVGLFLETVRDTAAFRRLARRAVELDKPIVALTVGRSDVAQRAAQAHTGALAGDAAVSSAVLRSLGVVEVTSLEELVATTDLLARGCRPGNNRIAVVGASGGACELIAEKADETGLEVPELSHGSTAALAEVLPGISHAQNPLDVTGFATVDPLLPVRALKAVLSSPGGIGTVLFQAFVLPPDSTPDPAAVRRHFTAIAEAAHSTELPVLMIDEVAAPVSDLARDILADGGLTRLPGIGLGLTALAHAADWTARREHLTHAVRGSRPPITLDHRPGQLLSEYEALRLLSGAGFPAVPQTLAASARDAVAAAASFGGPVALKICSPDVPHKSDVGGVVLDVRGDEAVAAAYDSITAKVRAALPEARLDGVLVSPMRAGGVELIVGVNRDPVWGPVLLIGLGGVLVEVLRDVALRPLPVTRDDVTEMLGELRGAALLGDVRGRPGVDLDRLTDAVLALTDVATALGDTVESIEVNPVRADHEGVEALDALIVPAKPARSA
jgi:acyl-CoA synthetase (NDP forming)